MATRVTSPTFVGRRHEVERLATALERARAGMPGLVLIAGEAGVGKTRFVHEIAAQALAGGAQVLEGGCLQVGAEGLPFGPIVEALRGLAQMVPPAELEGLLGTGRGDIARFVPQLAEPGEGLAPAGRLDSAGQARLFEHLLLLLGRLAEREPVLVILEDVHWADQSTLQLLGFLARNLRQQAVVLVATFRSDELHRRHPLVHFLAEQERAGRAERLELRRFDRAELTAFLAAIVGEPPSPERVEAILVRSQGNAFYAEELLAAGTDGRLSATLREVLLTRLSTLREPTESLVRAASAGGARVSRDLLAVVTDGSPTELDAAFREAVSRHVLVPVDGPVEERYAFRHALVQEAIYEELLPAERRRLHAAFAGALAAGAGDPTSAPRAAELAYHWQAANDLPRAFDAWIAAGVAAEGIYAFAEASASFEQAHLLWDRVADAASRAPIDRVALLARAAEDHPSSMRAVAYLRSALALVDAGSHPARAARLYERLGQHSLDGRDFPTALAAYREAVRLVPAEPPSSARAWALSGLGNYLANMDRSAEAAPVLEEAIAVAQAAGDGMAEIRAMVPLGMVRIVLGDVDRGLALGRRALDLSVATGDVFAIERALRWICGGLMLAGRDEEAVIASFEAAAYELEHGLAPNLNGVNASTAADALITLGRWDEAAAAIGPPEGVASLDAIDMRVALLAALRGDHALVARLAPGLTPRWAVAHNTFPALAEHALWQGEPQRAREHVQAALAFMDPSAKPTVRSTGWAYWLGLRAEAYLAASARARRSSTDLAEASRNGSDLLARMRDLTTEVESNRPYYSFVAGAWLTLCEAEFSRLAGPSDPDLWRLAADAQSAPYFRAYARWREGEAALGGRPRDSGRAMAALSEATEIATRLGADPLRRAVDAIALMITGPRQPRADDRGARPGESAGLSRREREVLNLLAAGRSDGEIAAALFISRKTASVHVANIKVKLGAGSRVEIVLHALHLGLVDAPAHS